MGAINIVIGLFRSGGNFKANLITFECEMISRAEIEAASPGPHFIGSWKFDDMDICDKLIQFFEAHPDEQRAGTTTSGLDETKKKCIDITIKPNYLELEKYAIFKQYVSYLIACFGDYKSQWPFLEKLSSLEIGAFNIKKYEEGGHFSAIHTERSAPDNMHRVLAFMTYLNDVTDCGETSFIHYGINIKPQKGVTLIWPVEWTHAHFGGHVENGSKYIITGWIQFK